MATRNPASVFPDPVGAATKVSCAARIDGQPWTCGAEGPSGKRRLEPRADGRMKAVHAPIPSPGVCRWRRGEPANDQPWPRTG